jgi:L-asparagine transporter-like permease
MGLDVGDESGWKQIHGDVFRFISLQSYQMFASSFFVVHIGLFYRAPSHLTLFTSLIGTGVQLLVLVFATILMSIWFYQRFSNQIQNTNQNSDFILFLITSFVCCLLFVFCFCDPDEEQLSLRLSFVMH